MTDPNSAFLDHKLGAKGRTMQDRGGRPISSWIAATFFNDDKKPPEIIGMVGLTETRLKFSSLVQGWNTEEEDNGAWNQGHKYVRFINGLVYNYTERLMATSHTKKPEIGIMFVRAQHKEG